MTLWDVSCQFGIELSVLREELDLPEDVSADERLGRLRKHIPSLIFVASVSIFVAGLSIFVAGLSMHVARLQTFVASLSIFVAGLSMFVGGISIFVVSL